MLEQAQSYWQNLSFNIFLLIFVAVLTLLYAFILKRRQMMGLMVAIYATLGLWHSLPSFSARVEALPIDFFAKQLAAFLLLLLIVYGLISFFVVKSFQGISVTWKNVLYGFFLALLFIKVNLELLPKSYLLALPNWMSFALFDDLMGYFWYLAPLLCLLIFKRSSDDNV